MRLAAGLCPDPMGKLRRSHKPLATIGGRVLLLTGREREGEGKGIVFSISLVWLRACISV